MPNKNRRASIKGFIRDTMCDVIVPASLGIGLTLSGCSDTSASNMDGAADSKIDQPIFAIMPPPQDGAADAADAKIDQPMYAILPPPMDASQDEMIYAVLPPPLDGGDNG